MKVENVFCVGRNYADHVAELENNLPKSPVVFSKPTHALVQADGSTIHYPSDRGKVHYEIEIVLHIGKKVTDNFSVDDVVTKMALGLDMTLRGVQKELQQSGYPWLQAKGFKNSAVLTDFWDFPGVNACENTDFSLLKNQETVQHGNIKSMIFPFQTILEHLQQHFGLEEGDIIYTGTPQGVGPISEGDQFELKWGNDTKGSFNVRR